MVRVMLVMHEPLGQAFAACAHHVLGTHVSLHVFDIPADADPDSYCQQIYTRLADDLDQQTLILCDIFGATPFNIANRARKLAIEAGGSVSLLAGCNLSMLLKALTYPSDCLQDFQCNVTKIARHAIADPDDLGC